MQKTKEELINTVIKSTYCDVCGEEIYHVNYSGRADKCCICGIDICGTCTANEEFSGDFIDQYCDTCWNVIGAEYRTQIKKLEDKVEKLYGEWYLKCKK